MNKNNLVKVSLILYLMLARGTFLLAGSEILKLL